MSKQLNVPSNADETDNDPTAPSELELTPREIAIAEGRDPDALDEAPAEEVVEEVEQEQPAAEVADDPVSDPPAEIPSGPWYSNQDLQYAAEQYGLSEWQLQQFDSAAEFRKAAHLLDAQAAKSSINARSQPAEPKTPAKEPEYVDEPIVDGKLNVEYYRKREYDEATIAALSHQQEKLSYFEQKFAEQEKLAEQQRAAAEQAEAQRVYQAFSDAASSHRPDFYGKTQDEYGNPVRLTAEQEKRRQELYEEVYWLAQRTAFEQERKGQPVAVPSFSFLIKQAEVRAPFAQELTRQAEQQKAAAAKAQSRTIRPAAGSVGAGTARRTSATPTSENVAEIAHDPDVIDAWERASTKSR